MRKLSFYLSGVLLLLSACQSNPPVPTLNDLAADYVRLGLEIGVYDPAFVDAYYGPDSLRYTGQKAEVMPAEDFRLRITNLKKALQQIAENQAASTDEKTRATWIAAQLTAFDRRIRIVEEDYGTFDEEATDLFGAIIPTYDAAYFEALVNQLDQTLPGEGTIEERQADLESKFTIPEDRLDTVFNVAIETARRITQAHFDLPAEETFTLEYVRDQAWSGYNWYQGNYKSLIQINLDHPIMVDRVIDLACHEGYPGHHVYNMLLEKNLYRDKGWVEISFYPLFSPQSLIAEGSANYGIDMAFPGDAFDAFAKEVLLPLAGLDTVGADAYFKYLKIKQKLNYARNEAARGWVNGTMGEDEVNRWLVDYARNSTSLPFIKKYRSYVVNYNYGKDLVKAYIESQSETAEDRWGPLGQLLSTPVLPKEMLIESK